MNFKQLKPDIANFRPEKLKNRGSAARSAAPRTNWIIVTLRRSDRGPLAVLVIVLQPQPRAARPAGRSRGTGRHRGRSTSLRLSVGRIRAQQFVEIRARVEGYTRGRCSSPKGHLRRQRARPSS